MRNARTARYASAMPCRHQIEELELQPHEQSTWKKRPLVHHLGEHNHEGAGQQTSCNGGRHSTLRADSWRRSATSTGLRQDGHAAAPCRSWNSTVRRMQEEQTAGRACSIAVRTRRVSTTRRLARGAGRGRTAGMCFAFNRSTSDTSAVTAHGRCPLPRCRRSRDTDSAHACPHRRLSGAVYSSWQIWHRSSPSSARSPPSQGPAGQSSGKSPMAEGDLLGRAGLRDFSWARGGGGNRLPQGECVSRIPR